MDFQREERLKVLREKIKAEKKILDSGMLKPKSEEKLAHRRRLKFYDMMMRLEKEAQIKERNDEKNAEKLKEKLKQFE